MVAIRQHPGGLAWFFYIQSNTIGQEHWLNYFAWISVTKHNMCEAARVLSDCIPGRKAAGACGSALSVFMFRRQQTDLPSLCFKSFCNFFLSRCESKELDVEIRNLIERSGVSKSCEDSELIAQGSLNHQRTSCSPKVNTLSQLFSVRAERSRHVPCVGYAGNCLISEMMHWTHSVFFFLILLLCAMKKLKWEGAFHVLEGQL